MKINLYELVAHSVGESGCSMEDARALEAFARLVLSKAATHIEALGNNADVSGITYACAMRCADAVRKLGEQL